MKKIQAFSGSAFWFKNFRLNEVGTGAQHPSSTEPGRALKPLTESLCIFHKSPKWLSIRTPAISGFASVLLYTSNGGRKASFIFESIKIKMKLRSAIAGEVGFYTRKNFGQWRAF